MMLPSQPTTGVARENNTTPTAIKPNSVATNAAADTATMSMMGQRIGSFYMC